MKNQRTARACAANPHRKPTALCSVFRTIVLVEVFAWALLSACTYIPGEQPGPSPPTPIPSVNQHPYALFSVSNPHPRSYYSDDYPGDPVTFDASASRDPDGEIILYKWLFRSPLDLTSARGVITVQTFSITGHYTVELTVIDDQGATDTNTYPITVYDSRCGGGGYGGGNCH